MSANIGKLGLTMATLFILAWPGANAIVPADSFVWFDGTVSDDRPSGKLLSDNQGYWGESVLTGVSYSYEIEPTNPRDQIPGQSGSFGRRLLDGRVGGNWHVPVGVNPGQTIAVIFDFKRPCTFTEVNIIATRTPRTSLSVAVGQTADSDWETVYHQPLEEAGEQTLKRAKLPETAEGRYLRVEIGSAGITYLDEILVWGEGEVSEQYPERIAPTHTTEQADQILTSIPGIRETQMTIEQFENWRHSIGDQARAAAVWAVAEQPSPSQPVLPEQSQINRPLVIPMARNETESEYLTLTNTSASSSLELTIDEIVLSHPDLPASQIEARLLVGGALPTSPPRRRLTDEQRLRLMLDDTMPEDHESTDGVRILPFFDQGQMLGTSLMRRYLSNGSDILNYPRLTLPPGGSAVFMLRATTNQALPGQYEGVVSATTSDGRQIALPLQLDVVDLSLPDLDIWLRTWGRDTSQFPFESEERRQTGARVKRQLGVTVWPGFPTPGSKGELFGATAGRTYYRISGIPSYYVHGGYSNRISVDDLTGEDEQKIVAHLQGLVSQAAELGLDYDDWFVELWDEPQERNVELFGVLASIIRQTDPRVNIYMNPLFWRPGYAPQEVILEKLLPYYNQLVDISVPIRGLVGDNPTTEKLWSTPRMVNAFFLHPPSRAGRKMAWSAFAHDFNGWGYYCYYAPRGNPWDIRTWRELSYAYQMVFPGPNGPIITPIYETMRDGWEDYRLLTALRQRGRADLVDQLLEAFRQNQELTKLRRQALRPFRR